jgi:hypothetical protein
MLGLRSAVSGARMVSRSVVQKRNMSAGLPGMLQKQVWKKSTGLYITYIVAGCVVIEAVYGGVTEAIWNASNSGVSLLHVLVPVSPNCPPLVPNLTLSIYSPSFNCYRNCITRLTGRSSRLMTTMRMMTTKMMSKL